ncbi:MAG: flagellar brake protein [Lachnospiraceae bacterium]|nr:flagellar brake protein [Lachnospiraceae bacterium]
MIEKFISPGDKLELKSTVNVMLPDGTEGVRTYKSSVYDILDDEQLELVMPMEQTKLVLLPVDGEYDVCFFSHGGMYRADVRIIDRQKINGTYILVAELISNLHKYQRREYYRFNCVVEMSAREMARQEVDAFARGFTYLISEKEMERGVIVDISGGGTRFVSRRKFNENSKILMRFCLSIMGMYRPFLLAARVICSNEIENRPNEYENRVKFEFIDTATREEIIKYIFDEERKNRKNGRIVDSYDN